MKLSRKNKMPNLGYKLTNEDGRSYCSRGISDRYYSIGKTSEPNLGDGPLCIFGTLAQLKGFLLQDTKGTGFTLSKEKYRIFEVEFEPSPWIEVWHYWKPEIRFSDTFVFLNRAAPGTILASSVTPIKELSFKEVFGAEQISCKATKATGIKSKANLTELSSGELAPE
jgi:hypothetical protein